MTVIMPLTEEIHAEILLVHGNYDTALGNASQRYWQDVWDYLKARHPELTVNPNQDYPAATSLDLNMLIVIWRYQAALLDKEDEL